MKLSKKISIILTLVVVCMMPLVQSCKKYPDGPLINFESRTSRVANNWRVETYLKNGTDYTSFMAGYMETFSKDGNYSYAWGNSAGTGVWAFQNSDEQIRLTGINHQDSRTLVILRLESKSFWYYYMDGNDRIELHMVPN